jgi:hypothetical protein
MSGSSGNPLNDKPRYQWQLDQLQRAQGGLGTNADLLKQQLEIQKLQLDSHRHTELLKRQLEIQQQQLTTQRLSLWQRLFLG